MHTHSFTASKATLILWDAAQLQYDYILARYPLSALANLGSAIKRQTGVIALNLDSEPYINDLLWYV